MSPRRLQEGSTKGPRSQEGPNEPPQAPGAKTTKLVIFEGPKRLPGTTVQHFWGSASKKSMHKERCGLVFY